MVRLLKKIMQSPPGRWRGRRPASAPRILLLLAASGACLFLSLTACCTVLNWEKAHFEFDFERLAGNQASRIKETFIEYQTAVRFVGNFLENSDGASRKEFKGFAEKVLQIYPGMQAVSWNPIISENRRFVYEEAALNSGVRRYPLLQGLLAVDLD